MSKGIMEQKALDAVKCYEDLKKRTGIDTTTHVDFHVKDNQKKQLMASCFKKNPFPGAVKLVLLSLRYKAVKKLFQEENVKQTGPAAAVLSLNSAIGSDIACLRDGEDNPEPILCDIGTAGVQIIRLYMMSYFGNKTFRIKRKDSAVNVTNALNGIFYKYQTKDDKFFSTHVYYEHQKATMMRLLGITKDPKKFTFTSLSKDKKEVAAAIKKYNGMELQEKVFESEVSGCVMQNRKQWEESEIGKVICDMPVFRLKKVADTPVKNYGKTNGKGPLAGVKVLDLTHIIAGPACTRILAEQGADVLLIRRGIFETQEQAMTELDGWAGKNSIQLDFNIPEQLAKAKELVKEADVVVSSYQQGALNKFGLSPEDIHKLNPNVIYGTLMCFSDTLWSTRPGWAPLAEDISGLSIRNGGSEKTPVNLNGVPLDYIPGFLLGLGVLKALKLSMTEGGSYNVTSSLSRAGHWLHECTDLCEDGKDNGESKRIKHNLDIPLWNKNYCTVEGTPVGTVLFPNPATYQKGAI